MRAFQRCTRCVMDTTDSKITFDENGVCDHCRNFDKNIAPYWKPNENRYDELEELAAKIREAGKNSEYDCMRRIEVVTFVLVDIAWIFQGKFF